MAEYIVSLDGTHYNPAQHQPLLGIEQQLVYMADQYPSGYAFPITPEVTFLDPTTGIIWAQDAPQMQMQSAIAQYHMTSPTLMHTSGFDPSASMIYHDANNMQSRNSSKYKPLVTDKNIFESLTNTRSKNNRLRQSQPQYMPAETFSMPRVHQPTHLERIPGQLTFRDISASFVQAGTPGDRTIKNGSYQNHIPTPVLIGTRSVKSYYPTATVNENTATQSSTHTQVLQTTTHSQAYQPTSISHSLSTSSYPTLGVNQAIKAPSSANVTGLAGASIPNYSNTTGYSSTQTSKSGQLSSAEFQRSTISGEPNISGQKSPAGLTAAEKYLADNSDY